MRDVRFCAVLCAVFPSRARTRETGDIPARSPGWLLVIPRARGGKLRSRRFGCQYPLSTHQILAREWRPDHAIREVTYPRPIPAVVIWQVFTMIEENRKRKLDTSRWSRTALPGAGFGTFQRGGTKGTSSWRRTRTRSPRAGNMYRSSIFKKMAGYFDSW